MFGLLDDRPPDVQEFCSLLSALPLEVLADDVTGVTRIRAVQRDAHGRLVECPAWPMRHWAEFCRAVDLFWRPEVQAWLSAEPDAAQGICYVPRSRPPTPSRARRGYVQKKLV